MYAAHRWPASSYRSRHWDHVAEGNYLVVEHLPLEGEDKDLDAHAEPDNDLSGWVR